MTRPSRAAIRVVTAFLSVSSARCRTWCSIVVTAPADGSTECVTGSVRKRWTSRSMFWSRVAENSIRCPSGRTFWISLVICGRKPMSVIWSASSRTVIRTSSRTQSPRSTRSLRRPGLATTTSTPRRSVSACRVMDRPPTTVVIRRLTAVAYGDSASVTCWASSLVGTSTSARGDFGCARSPAVRARSARPNARVLPEPVRPRPSRSRPAREFGSVAAWIGKGVVTPCAVSVFSSPAGMSRSAKSATGGSAGVVLFGSRNSRGADGAADDREEPDGEGDEARRFGLWGLRDIRGPPSWKQSWLPGSGSSRKQRKPGPAPDGANPGELVLRPTTRRGRCSPPAGPSGPA
ncbi:hypothetical protein Saa2_08554 [Streptomyces acidiscabies]|nr:hypothetical protein Saa2_08554 [Streptomyces acidiscabies]